MSPVQDSLEVRVLRIIEELLKDWPPDARHVFTNMVCLRMRVGDEKAKDEVAQAMSDLLADGRLIRAAIVTMAQLARLRSTDGTDAETRSEPIDSVRLRIRFGRQWES